MPVNLEKTSYGGWPNCYRLSNLAVELIVTADVGPRVIRFGFVGAENEFKEYEEQLGQTGGREWRIYGGTVCGGPRKTNRLPTCRTTSRFKSTQAQTAYG